MKPLLISKVCFTIVFLFVTGIHFGFGQSQLVSQAHSHNDYEQASPFWSAWKQGFGSIEADIFLQNGELIVAHSRTQLDRRWTLDSLYLQPLAKCITDNNGNPYKDPAKHLQLMIDIKTDARPTLAKLVEVLTNYPSLIASSSLQIVISGNRPPESEFSSWPSWIWFDGELNKTYTADAMQKIVMLSDNFANYSLWNGKGRLPEKERVVVQALIDKAHKANKRIRFWNAPDILNSWYYFLSASVDYINTDQIEGLSTFFKQLPDRSYTNLTPHTVYKPLYKNDGINKKVKNVILFIGDGTGLAQWYAGYTVNNQALNVFSMRHNGLSKTSSYDNYITDSAPGATALSSGNKTNNRAVGVDHTGVALQLLPAILRKKSMQTGIITSGDLRDATPAAFYAHQDERSKYTGILKDLLKEPVDIIIGDCDLSKEDSLATLVKQQFNYHSSINGIREVKGKPLFVADTTAGLSIFQGRGDWSQRALQKSLDNLSLNKNGFFLMLEGAQVDHGGHANQLPYVVTELLDFDKTIGKALEFADRNGETLIIVAADHETGGLTLTGGDYEKRWVSGQFSTVDHTAVPIPVFAYGPQSQLFDGVYENTAIFYKILEALGMKDYPH